MRYSKFVLLDGLAALVSVPVWIVIGYGLGHWFGSEIAQMLLKMKQFKNGFTILVVSIILVFGIRAYVKYQKAKKEGKTRRRPGVKPQLPRA